MTDPTISTSAKRHPLHRFDMRLIRQVIETEIECTVRRRDFPDHLRLNIYEGWTERIVEAIEREIADAPNPTHAVHPATIERVIREEIEELIADNGMADATPRLPDETRCSCIPLFGTLLCAFHAKPASSDSLRSVRRDDDCISRRSNV